MMLFLVFLVLAAFYESWTVPIAVLLVVPLGILGAVAAVTLRGMPNDVYFTIGLITIIGLAAKVWNMRQGEAAGDGDGLGYRLIEIKREGPRAGGGHLRHP